MRDLSFDRWVADLEAVVDAAGLSRFPIMGFCWGGPIAIVYAARHPERVSELVLSGTFMRGRFKRTGLPNEREKGKVFIELTRLGWGQEDHAFLEVWGRAFQPGGTLEHLRSWCELQRVSTSPDTAVVLLETTANLDVSDAAARVRCPVLVMHADRDGAAPLEEGRLLAARIPGARFVQLESTNHWLLQDEPAWPRFLAELRAFLRPRSASSHEADVSALLGTLSERETEVLEGIAQGLGNCEIAAHLDIAEKTVRNHITRIFDKLEVDARPSAIVLARKAGFGEAPTLSRARNRTQVPI